MKLHAVEDAEELAGCAAALVAAAIRRKRSAVIALPTGRTPLGLYERLGALRAQGLDTSRLRVVCIDEYAGIDPSHPVSLLGWLRRAALTPLGVPPERVLAVPATAGDLTRGCRAFDRELERIGGIDLAVLGLGSNGHVAFNEPGSSPRTRTRVVSLSPTLAQNRAYWGGQAVPSQAVTLGIATLVGAKRILLLASGREKATALAAAVRGPISPKVPASLLRQGRLTVIADRAAGALLRGRDEAMK